MIVLKRGSKGEEVKRLQRLLGIGDDGIFGYGTERAVKDFQRRYLLYPDGVVGKKTWEALEDYALTLPKSDIHIIDAPINVHITPLKNRPIKYIAIHFTAGGTSKKGTAKATRNVFLSRKASADSVHFTLLDGLAGYLQDVTQKQNISSFKCMSTVRLSASLSL